MASYGQIIYNVESNLTQTYVSTSLTGEFFTSQSTDDAPSKIKISEDIIGQYKQIISSSNLIINKIAIQAPNGTHFLLDNKNIMIGQSGIYEMQGVQIKSISCPKNLNASVIKNVIIDFIY